MRDDTYDYFCTKCGSTVELIVAKKCKCDFLDPKYLEIYSDHLGRTLNYPANWTMITSDKKHVCQTIDDNRLIMSAIDDI